MKENIMRKCFITFLLTLSFITFVKSEQMNFNVDSISESTRLSIKGKKLYNIGSKTNWIGTSLSMGLSAILSNALYSENYFTYFVPYNYSLLLGTAILGNGSDMVAQSYSGNKYNEMSKKAWVYYWTALSLEIAGITIIVSSNNGHFKALYEPIDLTKGGGVGTLFCLSSTVINCISWNKFYKRKMKTEDVFSVKYVPFYFNS